MTATELTRWLDTDESAGVGQKVKPGGESTGHHYGRRILELLGAKAGDLTDDDLAEFTTA